MHSPTVFFDNKINNFSFKIVLSSPGNYLLSYTDKKVLESLSVEKNKIEVVDQREWVQARKFINIYEYPRIEPWFNVVSGLTKNPASRAYYKLWEILHDFDINCKGESLHLAESPGGFIQATSDYKMLKYNNKEKCIGMSLNSINNNYEIPKFHKNLTKTKQVEILRFSDKEGNGDLTKIVTIVKLLEKTKNNSFSFITADGGINDKGDFNNKETNHINLIFCEFVCAILSLKDGGTFVVKIFDTFTDATISLIYLAKYLFDSVCVNKPLTSRSTNSEKYMICKGFKKDLLDVKFKNQLIRNLNNLENGELTIISVTEIIEKNFLIKLREYNVKLVASQSENIHDILTYIYSKKDKYSKFSKKKNILVKEWLFKYSFIHR